MSAYLAYYKHRLSLQAFSGNVRPVLVRPTICSDDFGYEFAENLKLGERHLYLFHLFGERVAGDVFFNTFVHNLLHTTGEDSLLDHLFHMPVHTFCFMLGSGHFVDI